MLFIYEKIGEIIKQIKQRAYCETVPVNGWKSKNMHFPIQDVVKINTSDWEDANLDMLGKSSGSYYGLAVDVTIPSSMDGMPVELQISTGCEGEWDATNPQIAAYVNGKLVQGLDVNHRSVYLSEAARGAEKYSIFMSVYTGESGYIYKWNSVLKAKNKEVYKLYYDLLVPWQCLELMEEESKEYYDLLGVLDETVNILDFRAEDIFEKSVKEADAYLKKALEKFPVSDIVVSCIGHTHIDVAWLWTYAVTQEKVARSFSTVLSLMEKYPDYQFMSSQAQLYKYVKCNQPELYKRIKERVKEGRWETEGGMFVEADCNLPSGESLVRQFVYGKNFFKEEFGKDHKILWLPDVFGYSAALPQIMKECGIQSFMTTKISWNEVNQIPYDSFWWEGIDGTRILTHFITTRDYGKNGKNIKTGNEFTTSFTTNYNGVTHPSQIKGAWQRYQQKNINDNVLVSYGYGDGGGGPTEWMLETANRLSEGKYGVPKVKQETAGEFFERLHDTADQKQFPVWSGELYLEYHRGTYTSMAENKRKNRKGEFALQNAENWAVLAERYGGYPYPSKTLYEGWEILMRNQFHDVLPGSAIEEVYVDSKSQYANLEEITDQIKNEAIDVLLSKIKVHEENSIVVFNSNGLEMDGVVSVNMKHLDKKTICSVVSEEGHMPVQWSKDGTLLFRASHIPAKGWKTYHLSSTNVECSFEKSFFCTENETMTPFYHLVWNDFGQITSFYDKRAGRELLQEGKCANVLMTYEDKPHIFDNWNIFEYYREKSWPVENLISRKVIERGLVRMALELKWKYFDSEITEVLYFYPDSPRIDIHTDVNWREDQILLKVLFPLELNAREATYEIQYGNVKRTITQNQSWEQARFEVCFQKWLDLAEYGYGVSFLSDCKYGVSIYDRQVELTLLKSGMYPNSKADRGHHEFIYSVYPHEGSWQQAGTVSEAYELNNPLFAKVKEKRELEGSLPEKFGAIHISEKNVIVEVLKKAEDGEAEVIRLYECWNKRTKTKLTFGKKVKKISICNMLEEEKEILITEAQNCELLIKPYEILTLRLTYE